MSTLKTDAIEAATGTNTDLELSGKGTGVPDIAAGFKVGGTAGVPVNNLRVGTDGELITWDASGNPATVAVGTATHILTSNGAGAAPTFQAAAGGGKLLQLVAFTTGDYVSTTSTSWVTTDLTADITPSATSSKILVQYAVTVYVSATGVNSATTIFRGDVSGTNLGDASHGFGWGQGNDAGGSAAWAGVLSGAYLDSPSTTSSTTYTIGFLVVGSATIYVGANGSYGTLLLSEIDGS